MFRRSQTLTPVIFSIGLAALVATGCAQRDTELNPDTDRPGQAAIEASGWDELDMTSDGAVVRVDTHGHFSTTFNRCQKDADGALDLQLWNTLVTNLNAALAMTPLDKEACNPTSRTPYALKGGWGAPAEVKIPSGKRSVFSSMNGDICSTIPNARVALELQHTMDRILLLAAYENCGTPPAPGSTDQ